MLIKCMTVVHCLVFLICYTPRCNPTIHVTLTLKVVSVFTIRTNFSFLKCILDIQLFPLLFLFLSLKIFQWQIYFVNIILLQTKLQTCVTFDPKCSFVTPMHTTSVYVMTWISISTVSTNLLTL